MKGLARITPEQKNSNHKSNDEKTGDDRAVRSSLAEVKESPLDGECVRQLLDKYRTVL